MITINELDSVNVKIDCDRSVANELSSFFTFSVPNFKFTPADRNKIWDGKIRLFNSLTHTIYAGLLDYIFKFAEERNYKVEFNPKPKQIIKQEDIDFFIKTRTC